MTTEKITQRKMANYLMDCDICGTPLSDRDKAYGMTVGRVSGSYNGFAPEMDDSWLTVACQECGGLISNAINTLAEEKGDK